MKQILCKGKVALQGTVRIQGSKNAALPVLAATLMTDGKCYIRNCPKISDVYAMLQMLESLGCKVKWDQDGVVIDNQRPNCRKIDTKACPQACETRHKKSMSDNAFCSCMRSSICLLGALIGGEKEVILDHPGGCVIGARPIDLHLNALKKMGIDFEIKQDHIRAFHQGIYGSKIVLPFPSVGATENVIMAAARAAGITVVQGAAKEPEIVTLCEFLNQCGAKIRGAGTSAIEIEGVDKLGAIEYRVPADRIVAGTYLLATAGCGGNVFLQHAPALEMESVLKVAGEIGACYEVSENGIYVQSDGCVKSIPTIKTKPYPGFPTDLQSIALAVLTIGDRQTRIEETVFENRFRVVDELRKMGASIEKKDEKNVLVNGVNRLYGSSVEACELRGGAALVVAGLLAGGITRLRGVEFIERGYVNICRDFKELGARITSG